MLSSLGWVYTIAVNLRNFLYDRGVFNSRSAGVPTISIGNITAGGAGKTPLAAYVAALLAVERETVCVISRGYKRKDEKKLVAVSNGTRILADLEASGDEPYELAQKLLGTASVVCDSDRLRGADLAKNELGATVIILDDAFQHRKIRRDLDIVVLDATDPFGGGKLIPVGRLREPIRNIRRAGLIVVTRSDLADDPKSIAGQIGDHNDSASVFLCRNELSAITELKAFPANSSLADRGRPAPETRPAFAFCAIGNPLNFFRQLRRDRFSLVAERTFRDHHKYTESDVDLLDGLAEASGAEILLTTAKDAVKLREMEFQKPCLVIENRLRFDNEEAFRCSVLDAITRTRP